MTRSSKRPKCRSERCMSVRMTKDSLESRVWSLESEKRLCLDSRLSTLDSRLPIVWHKHTQRARAHAIVERRAHDDDLAIGGDVQMLPARLDPDFAGAERVEVSGRPPATRKWP